MDITPLIPKGRQLIAGYGNGQFKINDNVYTGSILLAAHWVMEWSVTHANAITCDSMQPLLTKEHGIELLLIGTGTSVHAIAPEVRQALKLQGIAIDIMNTGAACRTYNVLLAEERRVAAALIAV